MSSMIDGRRLSAALLATLAAGVLAACGSAGGESPKPEEGANLYVKTFSLPNYNNIFLDEDLQFVLSAPVNEESINPDSIQVRTGPQGGTAPFGVYVRGAFCFDPATGNRIVIDPDPNRVSQGLILRMEKRKAAIPPELRIDLGFDEPRSSTGARLPLFDRTLRNVVTFVPEIPTRAALDDTGFTAGATYTVAVPGYPATNTLENLNGAQLLNPENRVFTSTFTVVPQSSPFLFLGAEAAGIPRIIHTDPYNGDANVAVTKTINIRFSHGLDPRTVTPDKFKVELVSVPQPYPQIGVSVFLAQQRLGKVEVILTPVNPLPPDGSIRVTVDSAIEDLIGQGLTQSTFSFSTGSAPQPPDPTVLEDFVNTTRQDGPATTANWNNTKPYVGGASGFLTAAFAPYVGDASDGAFAVATGSNTSLSTQATDPVDGIVKQRVYNYSTFSLPIGARLVASGSFPLVIRCQGSVDISGEVEVNGANGGHGARGDLTTGPATGGPGGIGGPGGYNGGSGAFATIGTGGNFDGINGFGPGGGKGGFTGQNDAFSDTDPFWPRLKADGTKQACQKDVANGQPKSFAACRIRECGGGAGFLTTGFEAANKRATELSRDGSLIPNGGNGGAAWGDAALATIYALNLPALVKDTVTGGVKKINLTGIPTLGAGSGGAGGGGGGGEDDLNASAAYGTAGGEDEGGGGGGGGGGSFQVVSYTTISMAGKISCNGGVGGSSFDDPGQTTFSQGAGGGGGSGGTIFLQCRGQMSVQPGAILSVAGGIGGQGFADGTTATYAGGTGSEGRIRLEDSDGSIVNAPGAASTATFAPTLDLDSTAISLWQDTQFVTPDFQAPTVNGDAFTQFGANSYIRVFLEGADENFSTGINDPDPNTSTGFIKVFDSNLGGVLGGNPWDILDNKKWWRFRVDFRVDAFHTFTDPMPQLSDLTVNIDF